MVIPRESRGSFFRLTVFSWLEKPLGGSCIGVQMSNKQSGQTRTIVLAFLKSFDFGSMTQRTAFQKTAHRNKCADVMGGGGGDNA